MNLPKATFEEKLNRICVRRLVCEDGVWNAKLAPVEGVGEFPLDDFLFIAATATSAGDICRCLGFDEPSLDEVCRLIWGVRTRDVLISIRQTSKTVFNSTLWEEAVKFRNTKLLTFEAKTRFKRVEATKQSDTRTLDSVIDFSAPKT
jgi:hypothetical protein